MVSRRVVTAEGERAATVVIDAGRIVGIEDRPPDGVEVHDHGDLAVLPGLVDSNVNAADPGRTHWEGFPNLTHAALSGGTTTVVDMPYYSIPATMSPEALAAKQAAARSNIWCHVGFWAGVAVDSIEQMDTLARLGVCGFAAPAPGDVDAASMDYQGLGAAALEAHRLQMPLLVQPTPPAATIGGFDEPNSYSDHLESWPPESEAVDVARVGLSAGPAAAGLHMLSLSAATALDVLPPGSTAETSPHYLTMAAEDSGAAAPGLKCSPPIRDAANREQLWAALVSGRLAMVVSDHRPIPPGLKEGDYQSVWCGMASVGLRLPLVWTGAVVRGCTLTQVADWLAAGPAWLAGFAGRGVIAPGTAADLCVFDPDGELIVGWGGRHSVSAGNPYEGRRLRGRVESVYLDGRMVLGADAVDEQPAGRLLRRG